MPVALAPVAQMDAEQRRTPVDGPSASSSTARATGAGIGAVSTVATIGASASTEALERTESIAEHMFSHKKLHLLEQGVARLQKTTREQHEVMAQLERHMGDTISEIDLRRAIGLALQEFESRLVDAFQDSNRKCIAMFAKQDDVVEIQGKIEKKVNCTEHNAVLQRLSDLKRYIDTMAESVFIGHRDALNSEFAKKADSAVVDEAMKMKADTGEVHDVRARLERLEAIVTANDQKHSGGLQDLRDDVTTRNAQNIAHNRAMIEENKELIDRIIASHQSYEERMGSCEEQLESLTKEESKLRQIQISMQQRLDGVIWKSCERLQHLIDKLDIKANNLNLSVKDLEEELAKHEKFSGTRFAELTAEGGTCKEQLKFLMDATENLKRRSREMHKTHTAQYKELSEGDERLCEHLSAVERTLKGHERDLKAFEKRIVKAGPLDAGFAQAAPQPVPDEPNDRLRGVLAQLEKIATQSSPDSKLHRPPLPGDSKQDEFTSEPRFAGIAGPAPIDSARTHGVYGLSPRLPIAQGARASGPSGAPGTGHTAAWGSTASRRGR